MTVEFVTMEELNQFRMDLVEDIKELLKNHKTHKVEWLRSTEAAKFLKVSQGTLYSLRLKGVISHTKIGNLVYYNVDEFTLLLDRGKC